MIEGKPIIELFQSVFQVLREWGLSEYSISSYYYEGIRPILVYYEDAGKETYDADFTALSSPLCKLSHYIWQTL